MPAYGASYHIHVTQVPAGMHPGLRVNVTRTRWVANRPSVSGMVFSGSASESRIDVGTPLEQAIASCELALAMLRAEAAQQPPENGRPI